MTTDWKCYTLDMESDHYIDNDAAVFIHRSTSYLCDKSKGSYVSVCLWIKSLLDRIVPTNFVLTKDTLAAMTVLVMMQMGLAHLEPHRH